ncbi:HEPN domain-containing protein [Ectothiorhodospira lacustris]|uniref:HEPN domain-containing protein n=1 Tax=Ectothiorhodospira lacustris TaxID=2899127 RepID=UPI001EE8149D|nr:HEPN domain-containing protein [Ectothiorhodospira lacustris]MCG5510361.1 HEPN domain-containing protein [Ectothiorhodospira lacustris]MCG5522107.1 HEPN domain-containing protein [Ectothiorhodospira lacustris]
MDPWTEQALQLLEAGARDQAAVHILARVPEAPHEIILFHAQQAMEKSLKSVLSVRQVVFRRTHDLLELQRIMEQHGIYPPVSTDLLLRLGPYAVEFRYLGAPAPDVGIDEAIEGMTATMEWAKQQVGHVTG